VQLARHSGADVYATASGGESMQIIETYGATPINYRAEQVADYVAKHTDGAGFDVVFDSVGGANITNSFEAAALNGQVATTVSLLELDLTPAHLKGLSLHVVFMLIPMLYDHKRETHGAILAKLAEIADAGGLKPLLDGTQFRIEEIGKGHDRLAGGQAIGKVVVEI
jgi:alcohol dehydrogenase